MAKAGSVLRLFQGREGVIAAVVIAIPLLYFLGFLAWAFFASLYGLAFLPLVTSQLMAAGLAVLVLVSIPVIIQALLLKLLDQFRNKPASKSRRRKLFAAHFLFGILTFVLTFSTFSAIQGLAPFLRMKPIELVLYFLAAGLVSAVLSLYGWHVARKAGHLKPTRKKLGKTPTAVRLHAILAAGLVMYVTFVVALFPSMRAEYHGPEPRIATLDIEQLMLSPETMSGLWPQWTAGTGQVVRTPEVRVVFLGENVIMLRSTCEHERAGALFTVAREHVPAIIWTGDDRPSTTKHCAV